MLQGSHPVIRRLLRARGWVERKERGAGRAGGPQQQQQQEGGGDGEAGQGAPETSSSSWLPDDDEEEEEEEEEEEQQDEEDPEGIHDLMSRLVRDQMPYFIWTTRGSAVQGLVLQPEQVVNHYGRVGSFTTKVGPCGGMGWLNWGVKEFFGGLPPFSTQEGLCLTLRNLPWFDQADPDTFFPRCYRLGAADERQAFIGELGAGSDPPAAPPNPRVPFSPCPPRSSRLGHASPPAEDFRLTAARSLLKAALERAQEVPTGPDAAPNPTEPPGDAGGAPFGTPHTEGPSEGRSTPSLTPHPLLQRAWVPSWWRRHCGCAGSTWAASPTRTSTATPNPPAPQMPRGTTSYRATTALCSECRARGHPGDTLGTQLAYGVGAEPLFFCSEGAVPRLSGAQREQGQLLLQRLAGRLPQLRMEGDQNVWILKPAAASRGRGSRGQDGDNGDRKGGPHTVPCPQASRARRGWARCCGWRARRRGRAAGWCRNTWSARCSSSAPSSTCASGSW
uniref:Tubulin monoglycylase TTLL3 n=1 Tax=Anas zonorhyncha TaxID=75864 RepID=A0A8B9V873_9AVES